MRKRRYGGGLEKERTSFNFLCYQLYTPFGIQVAVSSVLFDCGLRKGRIYVYCLANGNRKPAHVCNNIEAGSQTSLC